jgi:hypothetical protein
VKEQPRTRPVPLTFDPVLPDSGSARFFGLEEITDSAELLERAAALTGAFRAAADRAGTYLAIAAAELTDPRRFDRLTYPELAERIDSTPAAAQTLAERGRRLLEGAQVRDF